VHVVPEYDGLRIEPRVPRAWESFHVTRRFRGVVYDIPVENSGGAAGGVGSLRATRTPARRSSSPERFGAIDAREAVCRWEGRSAVGRS
jgi:cellobiose phosphorylase